VCASRRQIRDPDFLIYDFKLCVGTDPCRAQRDPCLDFTPPYGGDLFPSIDTKLRESAEASAKEGPPCPDERPALTGQAVRRKRAYTVTERFQKNKK